MSPASLRPHRQAAIAALVLVLVSAATLLAMGRVPICTCGYLELWHGSVQSNGNSQHIADWYSPSHFTHGLIMYFVAWLMWVRLGLFAGRPIRWALPIAVLVEAAWEVTENTPMVIDRYRAVTASFGYSGDSVINSVSDIAFMVLGFLVAARIPAWVSVALAIGLELLTLWTIRDNLTLNVVMLLWPVRRSANGRRGASRRLGSQCGQLPDLGAAEASILRSSASVSGSFIR